MFSFVVSHVTLSFRSFLPKNFATQVSELLADLPPKWERLGNDLALIPGRSKVDVLKQRSHVISHVNSAMQVSELLADLPTKWERLGNDLALVPEGSLVRI